MYTTFNVEVDFDMVLETDIVGFNDYLCASTGHELQDITWEVVGSKHGYILLEVSASIYAEEE